ncbi:MAG TPA: alpha/beta fold hydrolase [Geminicoccaceae bacterium]|nr:alpha/beta fold hydrolase [Geminicoccaceae bacterium]
MRVAYNVVGSGPPLVLIHGAFVDRHMWASQVEFLRDRHRVVTLDLRGHGETGPTPAASYSIPLFAADVEALLDHLGIERAILGGLSMGGMVAQTLAAARPDRVAALILANTVRHSAPTRWNRVVRDVFFPREVLWPALRWLGMRRSTAVMFKLIELFGPDRQERSRVVRVYGKAALRAMSPDEVAKVFEAFYHFVGVDFARLTMPALILDGEEDSEGGREQARALRGALPCATLEIVPLAGHNAALENPEAFNDAVARFLARLG